MDYIVFNERRTDKKSGVIWEPGVKYAIKREDATNYYIYMRGELLHAVPKDEEGASYSVGNVNNKWMQNE